VTDDTPQPPEEETPQPPEEETPEPVVEEEAAPEEPAPEEEATPEEPAAEEGATPEEPAAEEETPEPVAEEAPKRERPKEAKKDEPEVIPGADLEPDLVLDDAGQEAAEHDPDTEAPDDGAPGEGDADEPSRAVTTVLELAADARYQATGKRKRAVARVTLKPGKGEYTVNGRTLDEFFPRPTLQRTARGPLETAGQQERLDVVAKIHGGGVSSQAGALRHGIARALVDADPALRGELKRRGFLTRDPRVKERKKAGLKKARKRPQFSKR
jgi:small subunit ribosomal protein S9